MPAIVAEIILFPAIQELLCFLYVSLYGLCITKGEVYPFFLSEVLTYDVMGNIRSLNRDGTGANTYIYKNNGNSNQLLSVANVTGMSYVYDGNGNATTDGMHYKTITYNYLNLPQTVSGGLSYIYDATGKKLQKLGPAGIIEYNDGIQYTNGVIDFIQTGEGIALNSGGSYSYRYNLTDHLGNVRVTFKESSGTVDIVERTNYYAFGLRKAASPNTNFNRYLYNGKELQDELKQYDYGARFYDPIIGRWNVVDPLSEVSRRNSPYSYALNNPIRFIDVDGLYAASPIYDSETGEYMGSDSWGYLKGDVRFMKKEKFDMLYANSKNNVIDHNEAVENSISIADLPNTEQGLKLFFNAADDISKTLYKVFYGEKRESLSSKLYQGHISVYSNFGGINNPEYVGDDYARVTNFLGGNIEKVSINFAKRNEVNTAGNIFSLFEHEYQFHGVKNLRNMNTANTHKEVYKLQVNSRAFQYTSGKFRAHIINFYNYYNK